MNYHQCPPTTQALVRLITVCQNLAYNGFKVLISGEDISKPFLKSLIIPIQYELENISAAAAATPPRPRTVPASPKSPSTPQRTMSPRTPRSLPLRVSTPGTKYYEEDQAWEQAYGKTYGRNTTVADVAMNRRMGRPNERNAYSLTETSTTVTPTGLRRQVSRTASGPDVSVLSTTNESFSRELSTSGVDTSFYSDAEEHLT
ncbi:uncharacterized protein LOC120421464 [Culex pipiens pallens]|uniref:uncharacterized protein LOC120421464 n=1 Tax=Culex pipiens pallens TaxID=42434 RepID=UPI001954A9DB|nr:uncharacterized protein LOC120421464 [Culex pipiens pallens]